MAHVAVCLLLLLACSHEATAQPAAPTYTRDIAPITFAHCAVCHRPGDSAPFSMLTYVETAKHAKQIALVTTQHLMPPWLPEGQVGEFARERRLSDAQIKTLSRWAEAGAPEGNRAELPAAPVFPDGWRLGKPDLILELPTTYTLPADGKDIYRNFVLKTGLTQARYVRAVEMRPGNPKVAHHVFLMVESTGQARRRDGADGSPGYTDMSQGDAGTPNGQFLSWQPGAEPRVSPEGSPWTLKPGADIVLQVHLRTSGKPEPIRPLVALYFTDQPPTQPLFRLTLRRTSIDIPAGDANYAIESEYVLPVDVDVLNLQVHTHYLGKELRGYVTLPDGREQQLIRIPHWDFNWQTDYPYTRPVRLPRGTTVHMRFTYDNSAANPAQTHTPPQRVHYGLNSTDEMGELALQVRPVNSREFGALATDYVGKYGLRDSIEQAESQLRFDPGDAAQQANIRADLAIYLLQVGRSHEALAEVQRSLELDPSCARGHRTLGGILARQNQLPQAAEHYRKAITSDPGDFRSRADLGLALAMMGDLPAAQEQMVASLKLNDLDALTHANLARVLASRGAVNEAIPEAERASALDPEDPFIRQVSDVIHGLRKPATLPANP